MVALPAVLISGSLSIILIPLVIRVSKRNGWYDVANERKIHKGQIPRLGGVGIFAGFAAGILVVVLSAAQDGSPQMPIESLLLCATGVTLVFTIGLIDDFRNIPALWKAFGQVVAALFVVAAGCVISEIHVPFLWKSVSLGPFAYPITILWLVGMSNALNLIDGMDGLAGGVALIAALAYAVIGIVEGNPVLTLVALALAGGAIGFLFFNFPPASIFMGDSGSLVLGFLLAMLPLIPFSGGTEHAVVIEPITILFIPVLDTAAAIIRRLMRGEPVHAPDREHLHHKLLDLGLSTRQALVVIYGAAVALGGVAVTYHALPSGVAIGLFLIICLAGAVSMRVLSIRHAEHIAPPRVAFGDERQAQLDVAEDTENADRAAR